MCDYCARLANSRLFGCLFNALWLTSMLMKTSINTPQHLTIRYVPWFGGTVVLAWLVILGMLAFKIFNVESSLAAYIGLGGMLLGFLFWAFLLLRISEMSFNRDLGEAEIVEISVLGRKRTTFPLAHVRRVNAQPRYLSGNKTYRVMFAIYDGEKSYNVPVASMQGTKASGF